MHEGAWLVGYRHCVGKAAFSKFQVPMGDPACFPWHEVAKLQHYWLEADALFKLLQVREASMRYRSRGSQE